MNTREYINWVYQHASIGYHSIRALFNEYKGIHQPGITGCALVGYNRMLQLGWV